jgi:hypothetical protein
MIYTKVYVLSGFLAFNAPLIKKGLYFYGIMC